LHERQIVNAALHLAQSAGNRRRWAFGSPDRDSMLAVRDSGGPLWGDLPGVQSAPIRLAGDLAAVPPADLLQMLHRGKRSGLLVASTGSSQRAILLAGGNLAWASSSAATERTNELMCRLDLARATVGVAPERAKGELRRQIAAVLAGFLEMTEGVFSLRDLEPGEGLAECAFNTEEMLLSCLKVFDESNSEETLDPF
jgi:hypothetical protein